MIFPGDAPGRTQSVEDSFSKRDHAMTTLDMSTPQPSAKFWDRIADRYARRPIGNEAAYQKKLRITQDYLRPDMDVLEFGCGTGSTALVHAPFVKHILAIDISSKMIGIAEEKARVAGVENVTFRTAAIDTFEAPDASYDAVLGLSILHLLHDRDAAIAKVHQMLKPGGVFVSGTACIADTMSFFKVIAPVGHWLGLLPLVKIFSEKDLKNSLIGNGFEIEQDWRPEKSPSVFVVAKKPE